MPLDAFREKIKKTTAMAAAVRRAKRLFRTATRYDLDNKIISYADLDDKVQSRPASAVVHEYVNRAAKEVWLHPDVQNAILAKAFELAENDLIELRGAIQ